MTTYRSFSLGGDGPCPPWLRATGSFADQFAEALRHLYWQVHVANTGSAGRAASARRSLPRDPHLSVTMHLKEGTDVSAVTAALVRAFSERGIDVTSIVSVNPPRTLPQDHTPPAERRRAEPA